jgi:hypothetical protein
VQTWFNQLSKSISMKNRVLVIIILVCLIGCNKSNKLESILTANSLRSYWTLGEIDSAGNFHSSPNNYEFFKAGTYKHYMGGSINNRGNLFVYVDGDNTFEWYYKKNDSLFNIGSVTYKITKVYPHCILMHLTKTKKRLFLLNNARRLAITH